MAEQAAYGIAITGSDQTGKAAKSAERRLGQIPKHASIANKRFAEEGERSLRRHSRSILRTFGDVEQAGARIFGGRSITSGISGRLGAVRAAGAAAGTGLGEAAASGGVLSSAMGAVGVAAGATIGILAAAAYAAVSLANGWAKGAASIGRTSEIIGVGTKAMQEFSAAAERVGVDKDKATGALGSMSQNLNDARYGRNAGLLAILGRTGVGIKTKEDGTVDVEAMIPAIADALKRQNSAGRRTMSQGLGIGLDVLPAFTQGSKSLASDMNDASMHANVLTDDQINTGKRIARKGAIVGQMKDRVLGAAGAASAGVLEGGYDATIKGGQAILDGARDFGGTVERSFKPAAEKIDRAGTKIERASDRMVSAMGRGVIGVTRQIIGAAQATERKYGIPASITLGQYGIESGFGKHMPTGSNNPFGIKARRGEPFVTARTREEDRFGRSYYTSARFRKFGSINEAFDAHARLLATGRPYSRARTQLPSVDRFADALTGTYATDRRYGSKLKSMIHQRGFDQYDGGGQPIPVKVEVELRGAPAGTRVKTTAGRGAKPAVSHAYAPVHGG